MNDAFCNFNIIIHFGAKLSHGRKYPSVYHYTRIAMQCDHGVKDFRKLCTKMNEINTPQ